jgi:hypothetical protein
MEWNGTHHLLVRVLDLWMTAQLPAGSLPKAMRLIYLHHELLFFCEKHHELLVVALRPYTFKQI